MIKLGVSFISFCLRAVLENIKFKKLIYKTARPFIMETMLWPSLSIIIRNVLQTVPGFWTQVSAMFSTKIIIIMRYIACICWSVDKIGYQSCLAQCMTNMSDIAKCDLLKKKRSISHISIHVIFTIGYITNSQWPALQLPWLAQWIEHCVQSSQMPGFDSWFKTESFHVLFQGCSFYCKDHVHFHVIMFIHSSKYDSFDHFNIFPN